MRSRAPQWRVQEGQDLGSQCSEPKDSDCFASRLASGWLAMTIWGVQEDNRNSPQRGVQRGVRLRRTAEGLGVYPQDSSKSPKPALSLPNGTGGFRGFMSPTLNRE